LYDFTGDILPLYLTHNIPKVKTAIWKSNVFGKNSPNELEKRSTIRFTTVYIGIKDGDANANSRYINA
jgi:hypothetical protein